MTVKESYDVTSMSYFIETNTKAPAPTPFVYRAMEDYARRNFSPWMTIAEYGQLAKDNDQVDVWTENRRITHVKARVDENTIKFESLAGTPIGKISYVMYPPKPPIK